MNRNDVIDHLQIIRTWAVVGKDPIYQGIEPKCCEDVETWIDEALELLKEQEPKQVIGIADSIEGMEVGYCPSCDRAIVNKKIDETKFCKFCGQAVKWDGGI